MIAMRIVLGFQFSVWMWMRGFELRQLVLLASSVTQNPLHDLRTLPHASPVSYLTIWWALRAFAVSCC